MSARIAGSASPKRLAIALLAGLQAVAFGAAAASAAPMRSGIAANRELTRSAVKMLDRVGDARRDLRGGDAAAAKHQVDLALEDQTELATSAKALGVARLLPLYAEFRQNALVGVPIGGRPRASATDGIVGTVGTYTFAALDLMKSKSHLTAARTALADRDDAAASKALAAVGDDVIVANVSTDMPLVTARADLALADEAIVDGRYAEARTALGDGSLALGRYAAEKTPHAAAARGLAHAVHEYAVDIADDHLGANAKIDGWWSEIDGWVSSGAVQG